MATKLQNIQPGQPTNVSQKEAQAIHDANSAEMLRRLQEEVERRAAEKKST